MLWIIGLVRERTKRPVGEGLSSEMADWYQIGIGLADMSKIGIPWAWSMIYIGMPRLVCPLIVLVPLTKWGIVHWIDLVLA